MDLMDKFKKTNSANSAEGSTSAKVVEPNQQTKKSESGSLKPGDDLLGKVGNKAIDTPIAASESHKNAENSVNTKNTSKKSDDSVNNTVKDPDSWTKESALREIKKLREENKITRLKYSEQLEAIKKAQEEREISLKKEIEDALKAKKELDKLKELQEDKKRGIEEKLAHREARILELQKLSEERERKYQEQLREMELRLQEFESERKAQMEVYENKLKEELNKIPERFKEQAELLVKGAGNASEALVALNEAKLKGMFEDKTVIIDNSVPGAKDGARTSIEKLKNANKEISRKMTSQQKIRSALSKISAGEINSAFKGR